MARNRYTATATIERDGRSFTGTAVAWRRSEDLFAVGATPGPEYSARRFATIERETATRWRYEPDGQPHLAFTYSTLTKALQEAAEDAAAIIAEQVLDEEERARKALPADEVTTACSDCGEQVPVIATGEGYSYLPRCPVSLQAYREGRTHGTGHHVPRSEFDRVLRLREVQRSIAVSNR